ncbi:MAG: methyltransferase domain-containing protein [Actinobacteria bacterium]|nr:methyltransferase domain-containing protein [Actinomycetota bacterium]
MGDDRPAWAQWSFLVPPGELCDWRMVLTYDAAADVGLLAELPGDPPRLAERLGLSEHAVRVVLEALAVWDVVELGDDGAYRLGAAAPGPAAAAVLRHHARSIRNWGTIADRLRGPPPAGHRGDPRGVGIMLDALAVNGRESAPAAVDACLGRVPGARHVLDLGGGHGEYALEFARRGLRVTMQDRPAVIELAGLKSTLAEAGVELFAGDFFETLPASTFDLVFCAGVVYTLGAERNVELFRRVRSLLSAGGSLAVHTFLRGTDPLATLFAVQMLGATGGDSHGEDDHRRWLTQAGYGTIEVQRLPRRPEWLVFATPVE